MTTPRQEPPAAKESSMSLHGTTTSSASSKPSPSSSAPAPSTQTSPPSEPSKSRPAPDESSGSGSTDKAGRSRYSSEIIQRKIAFSRLLKQRMEALDVTSRQLSELTGVGVHSINRYRSSAGPQLPLPKTASLLADALMAPRLRSLASVTNQCEMCSVMFELQSKKRASNRFCSERCQRAARNRREERRTNTRLSADLTLLRKQRDEATKAISEFCSACAGAEMVCPDRECPIAPITPLPLKRTT